MRRQEGMMPLRLNPLFDPDKKIFPKVDQLAVEGVVAVKRLNRKLNREISSEKALDALSRSLCHESFLKLKETYSLKESDKYFKYTETWGAIGDYNIPELGLFYSEYRLRHELNIHFSQAIDLKHRIDRIDSYYQLAKMRNAKSRLSNISRWYDGNIVLTSWDRIKYGISQLSIENNSVRLMGDWPMCFYGRYKNKISLNYELIDRQMSPVFLMDYMYVAAPAYFPTSRCLEHFVCRIIDLLITKYDLAIERSPLFHFAKPIHDILTRHYNFETRQLNSTQYKIELLYLPRQKPRRLEIDPITLGERVKQIRTERGMTQEDLAFESGLTKKTISSIENNHHDNSKLSTIKALARALEVSTTELLSFTDPDFS